LNAETLVANQWKLNPLSRTTPAAAIAAFFFNAHLKADADLIQ
jgi:hypothetical protein